MAPFTVRYDFTQSFSIPPKEAYNWCTNYHPDDWSLMGKQGRRKITKISADTIVLDDTVYGGGRSITKRRLVRLDPARLSWTNTHLTGPNKYSQFHYKITPEGWKGSRLEFTGLQVEYGKTKVAPEKIESLASKYKEEDSEMWRHLARAMEKELG